MDAPTINGDAMFGRDRTVRRHLSRWWDGGSLGPLSPHNGVSVHRWAVWLLLNPSNAGESKEDPTSRRIIHFSKAWGYGGYVAVNIWPFVTSDPREMWRRANWEANGPDYQARDDMQTNLKDIERFARMASIRVVAFGAEAVKRNEPWLEQCLEAFGQPTSILGKQYCYSGMDEDETGYDRAEVDERLYCIGVNSAGQPLHPMARGRMRAPDDAKPVLWVRP